MAPNELPVDFLSAPAPDVVKIPFDFKNTELDCYAGCYATILDNVFTADECAQLVKAAEATTDGDWPEALIDVGGGKQILSRNYRKGARILWHDKEIVDKIWKRIAVHVPEVERLEDFFQGRSKSKGQCTGLSDLMRFLKYRAGDFFKPHSDSSYVTPDGSEESFLTLHLYLNDSSTPGNENLVGGNTPFFSYKKDDRIDIAPKTGRVLLFDHRIKHSGDTVLSGMKLTMRATVMYKLEFNDNVAFGN